MIRPSNHAPANDYPAGDGKPIWETDWHRVTMTRLLDQLAHRYRADPNVYISGGLFVFHRDGDRRVRVTPDVFVVKGVPKLVRDNFLIWHEGKGPDVVIELTSRRTRRTDWRRKVPLYRDVLKVPELFVFDVRGEYLDPPFRGFRLRRGEYTPIKPRNGRLASNILGLHFEREGTLLRLWDPATNERLLTTAERLDAAEQKLRVAPATR